MIARWSIVCCVVEIDFLVQIRDVSLRVATGIRERTDAWFHGVFASAPTRELSLQIQIVHKYI